MLLEPAYTINGTQHIDWSLPPRWRHMKYVSICIDYASLLMYSWNRQACGENLRRYGNRMDSIWAFRSAYNEARKIKQAQDDYCMQAEAGLWEDIAEQSYPDSLQWEMLVDVLRGRVKVSIGKPSSD